MAHAADAFIARRRGGHARVEGTRIGVHDVIGLIVNAAA
jgi:uncharacterized protein (DUF433 family)